LGYATVRGEGKMEKGKGEKDGKASLSMFSETENIFSLSNFDTIGGILIQ
jgi:hypothetical protein